MTGQSRLPSVCSQCPNVGGVTIHRLLQLPIEHEGRPAGYWQLGKDAPKVMCASLSQLRLLIVDGVSMVSSLNLVYIHLRLEEIFARKQWFGGVNVLFVGDILQLPPANGASVFEKMTNKSVASKLGCMTSVNIWQDCVVYDELTINERQKSAGVFSSMLDEVQRGCPSQKTIEALQDRVITSPVVESLKNYWRPNSLHCVSLPRAKFVKSSIWKCSPDCKLTQKRFHVTATSQQVSRPFCK